MAKNAIPKVWHLLQGGDGATRSWDPFGLIGNGLSDDELKSQTWREMVAAARDEAGRHGWTLLETQQVLLQQVRKRQNPSCGPFEILLQAKLTTAITDVTDGEQIRACAIPWIAIYEQISRDPNWLENFSRHPRAFEEFIAGAYDRAGWDEVILTPRSGDGGRDVIAIKHGFGSIRFLEQTKAYRAGHLVGHDDVRAMLGVLQTDPNSSKGLITTTSDFQPTIRTSPEFQRFLPHRLELKGGAELKTWISGIEKFRRSSKEE